MFENSVVESKRTPLKKNRLVVLPLSIALHAGAVAGLLFAGVWSVSLPGNAPPQIAAFIVRVPAPALPAGGGGPKPKPSVPQQPSHPRPAEVPLTTPPAEPAPAEQTPSEIPDDIPDLEPGTGGWTSGGGDGVVDFGGGGGSGDGIGSGSGPGSDVDELPVPVGGDVVAPRILSRVEPRYPDLLIRTKLRGNAVVECVVDREGNVESVRTIASTHALFAESAIDAVRQWRFAPGRLNGRAVKTIFTLSVNFEVKR